MMTWTIDLEAKVTAPEVDIESMAEDVLDTLYDSTEAMGAITYFNARARTLGFRFDLEAEDYRSAVNKGVELVVVALALHGVTNFDLFRGHLEQAETAYNSIDAEELVPV